VQQLQVCCEEFEYFKRDVEGERERERGREGEGREGEGREGACSGAGTEGGLMEAIFVPQMIHT